MRRRLLAVTVLAVLALAQVLPASAGYVNLAEGSCSGYGATNTYWGSNFTAADTTGTTGCFHWLRFRWYASEFGYYIVESPVEGYSYQVTDSIGIATSGWSTHLLGPNEWTVDGGDSYS